MMPECHYTADGNGIHVYIDCVIWQLFILGGSFLTSMEVKNLGVVFALVGATGATIVSFTLPGAAYYAMHASQRGTFSDPASNRIEGPRWKLYGAAGLVITGCVLTPVCLVFIFI